MKIQAIQNQNTNFQGLHVDKKFYKQAGNGYHETWLLQNQNIRRCADKFEVVIERGKAIRENNILRQNNKDAKVMISAASSVVAAMATMLADVFEFAEGSPFIPLAMVIGGGIGYLVPSCIKQFNDCNAYERIENQDFKRQVKNLKVIFPNIEEAIKLGSRKTLDALLPEFQSPFCDITEILNHFKLNDEYNTVLNFLRDNGIEIRI